MLSPRSIDYNIRTVHHNLSRPELNDPTHEKLMPSTSCNLQRSAGFVPISVS